MSEPHIISSASEYQLDNVPSDAISNLHFAPDGAKMLLVSSWDSTVRLYEMGTSLSSTFCRLSYQHQGPVLDCAFLESSTRCVSGGLDNMVKMYDFESCAETILGAHEKPVRSTVYCPEMSLIASGGWDAAVKLWDPRTARSTGYLEQPGKVYSMTVAGDRLIVATAGRKVSIWNLRNTGSPEHVRDSSLKYQTRCVRAFPNKQAFVLTSIEGRVSVEYLDNDPEMQKRKYAFKCHRSKDESTGLEIIYPVNSVAFHPLYNTFATGGSDALVNMWDPFNKKRLCQFHKYPTSISALAFNADGSFLAVASSYLHELLEPPNPMPTDSISIRKVTDHEAKPKT